ncbi:MAG: Aldose 1-epimerase [Gemmatimonadetes bacterium]|nr:Aldose 1-epimerase [Gemmatimonadota bacterium]
MSTIVPGAGGLEKVVLHSDDGASAEIYLHGAHVTSWRPSPGLRERLFLSSRSGFHAGAAIRGGIPVIFPQFATEGPLPRHGFARTAQWAVQAIDRDASGDALASFVLTDAAGTRTIWPHAFRATLSVRIGGTRLAVTLGIENTGDAPFSFTAALHTYLRVDDVCTAELLGLHGTPYRESGARDVLTFEQRDVIRMDGEVDRVFVGAPVRLTLREPSHALDVEKQGFPDVVLWNPGPARAAALADMEAGGDMHMLCVEAAAVQIPVTLDAGQTWTGSQRFADLPARAE